MAASFEKSIERIEAIVRQLEKGDAPLADALKLYEEGTALITACNKMLDEAEQRIVKLIISETEGPAKQTVIEGLDDI